MNVSSNLTLLKSDLNSGPNRRYRAGLAFSAPSIELFEVDRGVHNVSRTAMIAAMITIATTGLPSLAISVALGDCLTMTRARRYTRAVSPARRSAAWSSVSCFLQNAKRIMFFPRPLPA